MGEAVTIEIEGASAVSGLWDAPKKPKAVLVLAHGAGAGMTHRHMTALAEGLAARSIAVLRYNFPYMERGSARPDAPTVAHKAVRAAIAAARTRAPRLPLFAGGRSFGGRMTSQAEAERPTASLKGLVFFAFPLHLAGKPAVARAEHLGAIEVPMLFLQGTRDTLAELALLEATVKGLKPRAMLHLAADADHSFHVPAKTGRKDEAVLAEMLDAAALWMVGKA